MIQFDKDRDLFILVDFQNDFITGALAVKGAETLVPTINKYIDKFKFILATKDWHPPQHSSFKEQGGPWPPHCVQKTWGSELHAGLDQTKHIFHITKGEDPDKEAYSAFGDKYFITLINHVVHTAGRHNIFIGGLATDYCVKAHALDAAAMYGKFKTDNHNPISLFFLADASMAVNVNPDDGEKAIQEMVNADVIPVTFNDIVWE